MAEKQDEDREVRDLQEERSRLLSLLEHPGFKYYREILQTQVEVRTKHIILNPLKSLDEVPQAEYAKGEAAGIDFAERFVDVRLEDLAEQIDERLKEAQQQKEEGHENTDERDE